MGAIKFKRKTNETHRYNCFINYLSQRMSVAEAAKRAGFKKQDPLYERRKYDPEFADRWRKAKEFADSQWSDLLLYEAYRRAMEGSDKLLMKHLERFFPKEYGPRQALTLDQTLTHKFQESIDYSKLSDEELERLQEIYEKAKVTEE